MERGPPIDELHLADVPDVPAVDAPPGPRSRELLEAQAECESGAVRYPHDLPLAIAEARGATIRDPDGNVFVDCTAGIGVANVGHSNPAVTAAVAEQSATAVHTLDFPSEVRGRLVDRLSSIAPIEDARVLFGGPTGSDAVEATIKLARAHTGGRGLLAFRGAYHGGTAGALSLTACTEERDGPGSLLADVQHVRYPFAHRQGVEAARAVELALAEVDAVLGDPYGGLADPAGIWVEPIQGEGGIVVPPSGFLRGLRELADRYEVPLIVDEVQTGIGRTGEWFACQHEGVEPDIVPVAKGLANGHPLSATLYDPAIEAAVEPGAHTGTFRGYLPGMRAALATLDYVAAHDLRERAARLGERAVERLSAVARDADVVTDVRGRGLYVGVEFGPAGDRGPTAVRDAVRRRCFDDGVIVWGGGREERVVRVMPPLVVTDGQFDAALTVLEDAIDAVDAVDA